MEFTADPDPGPDLNADSNTDSKPVPGPGYDADANPDGQEYSYIQSLKMTCALVNIATCYD